MRAVRRKIDGQRGDREANKGGGRDGIATGSEEKKKKWGERVAQVRRKRWAEECAAS